MRIAVQLWELLSKSTIFAGSRKGGNKAHRIGEVHESSKAKSGTVHDKNLQYRQDIVFPMEPEGLGRYLACCVLRVGGRTG